MTKYSYLRIAILGVALIAALALYFAPPPEPTRVFQIGFNKCGTTTLMVFFKNNGVNAVHNAGGKIANIIYNNHLQDRPLLSGLNYQAYFDMENPYHQPPIYIAQQFFKELDKQYPNSKFILNTRNKQAWLKSRSLQRDQGRSYIQELAKNYAISTTEVLELWSQQWDAHHAAVLEHFKDRPQDLLVFNIETDPPEKLSAFLSQNYSLNPKLYQIHNQTKNNATQ